MRAFLLYVAVQVLVYGVDYSVYTVLILVSISPIISNVISKLCAGVVAFFVHRRVTFSVTTNDGIWRQAGLYGLSLAINIPLASALLYLFLSATKSPLFAKLIADVCGVAINFLISKFITFRGARLPA
jgi:putative flippase GtrA